MATILDFILGEIVFAVWQLFFVALSTSRAARKAITGTAMKENPESIWVKVLFVLGDVFVWIAIGVIFAILASFITL